MSDITVKATVPPEITSATAKDNARYAISGVQVRRLPDATGLLVATDGRMIALRECEAVMSVDSALIPAGVLRKSGMPINVELNGAWTAPNGKGSNVTAPVEEVAFPPIEGILPDLAARPIRISLNATLLAKLAKAISTDGVVTIGIPTPDPEAKQKDFHLAVEGDQGAGVLAQTIDANTSKRQMARYARLRDFAEGRTPTPKAEPAAPPAKPVSLSRPRVKSAASPKAGPPARAPSKLRDLRGALAALGAI